MKKITSLFALGAMLLLGSTKAYAEIGDALDRTGWTVNASSWCEDSGTGEDQCAIDGVTNFWHSNWGNAGEGAVGGAGLSINPEYLLIDLGEIKTNIGGFGYKSRETAGANGNILDYKIYVSETAFEIEAPASTNEAKAKALELTGAVCEGTFVPNGGELNKVSLDAAVSGRYVLLVALSSEGSQPNQWANCDEFYVYEYTNDMKPALIEKVAAAQVKADAASALVGTNPGQYTSDANTAINILVEAIAAAQAVVDDEASTDEGEQNAITALEAAIAAYDEAAAAFATNPVVSGVYKLISGNSAFYNTQGVYKSLFASSNSVFAWGTVDESSLTHYWNVEVGADGNVTIKNAAYETYISGMGTLAAEPANVTCNLLGSGQFALVCNGTIHANNHGGGAGVGGNIVSWTTGAGGASAWIFEAVAEIPQEVIDAWVWINSDMEVPVVPGKRVSTLENGKQYFIFNTAMNGTEDRTGFLYSNNGSFGHNNSTRPSAMKLTANNQWSYVWTVETTESGKCYIKTYDGKYINNKGAYVDTPYEFTIEEWTASTVERAGVSSLAEDDETIVANAEITADNKVWTVSCDATGNNKCWNGNSGSFATWASAHPYAFYEIEYDAPFEAGNYYLKNVESGMFLGAGNSWGTQASLIAHPEHVTLAQIEGGKYTLESRVSNGGTQHYLGANGFMDNGTPASLIFTAVGEGEYYTMRSGDAYYGYDGTSTVMALNLAADAPGALWQVVSEADMKASLATATAEVPVDATFLIKDHNFSRNHRDAGSWTKTNAAAGGTDPNKCMEAWKKTFSVSQSLADVPNGVYALTAQGFYRIEGGGQADPLPVFFANEATSPFPLRTGTENSMSEASASFTAGLYYCEPVYVEVTDGTLTIGAKSENTGLWQIWDHFTLKYYGETTITEVQKVEFVKAYNVAFAAAQEAAGLAMFEADKAIVDQAIADNTLDTAAADAEQLAAATDALKAATAVAEKAAVKYANAQRAAEKIANVDGNFTEFIANPGFEVNGVEGWSADGTAIHGAGNTNFELMSGKDYAEAWVWSASAETVLGNGKLFQQIEGLPAGTYTLTAEMKVVQQGGEATLGGFFLQLGAERAEVSAPGTYTVTYEYDGTGALEVAAVLEGCTGNWVCVDNFQLSFPVSPDNVVANPENNATVEGKLAPVTLTFSDYDVITVNPENLTPFSISENGGEMMVVKKGVFVDENTEDNSVVIGIDFWGALSPIASAPGVYTIEIPAGKFLLGAEKVASKKVTLTYTVEAYKPVTPAVEVSLEGDNNVKLLFTEYASAITNTESTDKIVVKSGEEVVKELTQADVDYATEWNGLVVKAGLTEPGTYTIELPANLFLFAKGESEEPIIPNAAFTVEVTVEGPDNVVANPENGTTVEGKLDPITLTFADYEVVAVNVDNFEPFTISVDGAEAVSVKNSLFLDENEEDNVVSFGVGMMDKLTTIVAEPGTYTIVIPAGKFLLGADKVASKEITLTYTVKASELVTPVCRATQEADGIKLLFDEFAVATTDYSCTESIVIKSGDEVVKEMTVNDVVLAMEWNGLVLPYVPTESGTYTIEIPASIFLFGQDMMSEPTISNAAFSVNVTLVASGISSVKVNGEDKAYTLSGNRARKNYKGVVIINGKRYIRK